MQLVYRYLFSGLWLSWILYWLWAARHAKPNARLETVGSRLLHAVPLLVAVALLWVDRVPAAFLGTKIFPDTPWPFWIGASLTVLGMLFSVWARVHLGRNWSAVVTVKENHELIDTGPYALVRHPDLHGLARRDRRIGRGAERLAWRRCGAHRLDGSVGQAATRGALDDRAVRGTVHRVRPASPGFDTLCEMASVRF
jgi:hypothetical protein